MKSAADDGKFALRGPTFDDVLLLRENPRSSPVMSTRLAT